ncbi:23S rRNA pseudouridine(2604) synthase RluF [Dysgonomonas sp. 521]|uniref:23S rRNA pseudouridine(2604) synthase RluF n=1 Tax=Dysgonomonas sp. 521 TaxID=2302932 RepID=UPI0013D7A296|nr:23S rRNA pseudouridine(2604) synthase RluF [Dysgonomonas sp. 521]NDV93724.1 23S rRNA pseudouridine(2604) synthase RluF [Dysgonomonas sp. 521]
MRINKYISDSGYCSRREADKLIEQGSVTINGKRATIGSQVLDGQEVKIYGETIINNNRPIFIAYNKPLGIVSTTDPGEHNNILDAVGHEERIFPIGRLDKDSQGLIILTNEGDIVNKMLRADNNHEKEYSVIVDKLINEDFVNKMQNGIPILGIVTRKCEVVKTGTHSFNIVLRQGLNRQIRRMCEYLGYKVLRLERVRIMHIKLGNIKTGKWRNLTQEEVEILRKKTASSVKTESSPKKKVKPQQPVKTSQPKKKPANNTNKEWNKSTSYKENKPSGQRNGKTKATPRRRP